MKIFPPLFLAASISLAVVAACKTTSSPVAPRTAESLAPDTASQSAKLGELAKVSTKTDKGPTGHNYVEVYERFIFQWRYDPIKVFEIGIDKGGSLVMWEEYFPKASIYGLDINDMSRFAHGRVKTIVGDQSKRHELQRAIDISGGDIDILIDDGGHTMEQQQVSLGYLFKFVKPGGYYILEDLHTSIAARWPDFGAEPNGNNSTLRMIENYMWSEPPTFKSKYMLSEEMKYLNENVEFANLFYRSRHGSIVCIFKKKSS
jgi:cephalosporin hydroxylase